LFVLPSTLRHPHSFPTRRSSDLHAFRSWWEQGDVGPQGKPVRLGPNGRDPAQELRRMVRAADSMRPLLSPGDSSTDPVARFASRDRKSTRLNSSHDQISYAVFCL